MAGIYTASFQNIAITATQDLFNLVAPTTSGIAIHAVTLGQKTLTAWEAKDITFRRWLNGTVTAGSGGASVTPVPLRPGDGASACTVRRNDTVNGSSTGTATIPYGDDWFFLNGFLWLPAPEQRIQIPPGGLFSVRLDTAPSGSMTCSGTMIFEELQ